LHQRESAFETGQATVIDRAEQQLPIFTGANQNMDAVVILLDTLPSPSTDGVDEVYQGLKNMLGTTATQQG
jgi:hypothetical protein